MPYSFQTDVTVLIAARNAGATIRRAIRSVRTQSSGPIILVDDFSEDQTVKLARLESAKNLTVVRPPHHGALGFTRQCGLNAIETPLTLLLDADDALLPGRLMRFAEQMNAGNFDIWADELLLCDGADGRQIRHIAIPDFIASSPVPYRLFERNYLPGVGQVGYKTDFAKAVGYDHELHGPEDIDIVLRMLLNGGSFAYDRKPGYLMYTYPSSVSRDLERQKSMYAKSLSKFPRNTVEKFYLEHGASKGDFLMGFLVILLHQSLYEDALELLAEFEQMPPAPEDSEAHSKNIHTGQQNSKWRVRFYKGSLNIKVGKPSAALTELKEAIEIHPSADAINNLGCALRQLNRIHEAHQCFRRAIQINPQYLDAQNNIRYDNRIFVTLPELRLHESRREYS